MHNRMVKQMLKISKKGQISSENPRNRCGNYSFKRAIDINGQDSGACGSAARSEVSLSLPDWRQTQDSSRYQIEAEQKRSLAMMYASTNRFL